MPQKPIDYTQLPDKVAPIDYSGLPDKKVDKVEETAKGLIPALWSWANTAPEFITKPVKKFADDITSPEFLSRYGNLPNPFIPGQNVGQAAGFVAGAGEAAANMLSPLNAATAAAGAAEYAAGKAALPGLFNAARTFTRGAGVLTAEQGVENIISPESTIGERLGGVGQLAGGIAGARNVGRALPIEKPGVAAPPRGMPRLNAPEVTPTSTAISTAPKGFGRPATPFANINQSITPKKSADRPIEERIAEEEQAIAGFGDPTALDKYAYKVYEIRMQKLADLKAKAVIEQAAQRDPNFNQGLGKPADIPDILSSASSLPRTMADDALEAADIMQKSGDLEGANQQRRNVIRMLEEENPVRAKE
jgi:hypothetical protein